MDKLIEDFGQEFFYELKAITDYEYRQKRESYLNVHFQTLIDAEFFLKTKIFVKKFSTDKFNITEKHIAFKKGYEKTEKQFNEYDYKTQFIIVVTVGPDYEKHIIFSNIISRNFVDDEYNTLIEYIKSSDKIETFKFNEKYDEIIETYKNRIEGRCNLCKKLAKNKCKRCHIFYCSKNHKKYDRQHKIDCDVITYYRRMINNFKTYYCKLIIE